MSEQFWRNTALPNLTKTQWESLCDGCGRCCLHKFEDAETLAIHFTDIHCQQLNIKTCRCKNYENRQNLVPGCLPIRADWGAKFNWLPDTCAYRLISENKPLFAWHPLISGTQKSVELAGISIKGRTICERDVADNQQKSHIIKWITA